MMALVLIAEILTLAIVSKRVSIGIYSFFLLIFRNRSVSISIVTLLLFPGTVIHELSHLFTAEILGVHTGKLTLAPESIEGDEVRTGSVALAVTDPFRRYVIGLAPVFVGSIALGVISYFLSPFVTQILHVPSFNALFATPPLYLVCGMLYLLFAISNAMFSSKEDLKGFIPVTIVLFLLVTAGYFAGIRIGVKGIAEKIITTMLSSLTQSLGIVLALNIIILLVTTAAIRFAERLTHRRLIQH